jgi:acyl carrier protein
MHDDQLFQDVQDLIRTRLLVRVDSPDMDLLESGALDSMALVELLVALEERFGLKLNPSDLDVDSFRSVRSIADLVSASATSAGAAS